MRQAATVIALFVFCALALVVPSLLMDWRLSRERVEDLAQVNPQAEPPLRAVATMGSIASPAISLVEGVRQSLAFAVTSLAEGRRTDAVEALDGARRVAGAASTAFSGTWGTTFTGVLHSIEEARRRIQNGRAAEALPALHPAVQLLDALQGSRSFEPRPPGDLNPESPRYDEATVVDPRGRVVGECVAVRQAGAGPEAMIRLGGWFDVLGLVDLGGRMTTVPAGRLVFGEPSAVRETIIVMVDTP